MKKSLKGYNILIRHDRADRMTGVSKDVVVPPYFRNTFLHYGGLTVNIGRRPPPCLYSIGEEIMIRLPTLPSSLVRLLLGACGNIRPVVAQYLGNYCA